METFKDFFTDLKNRAGNPLISSFVISWLVFNWKIPVALFFYNHKEVIFDGYLSYFDLITRNSVWYFTIVLPLTFAGLYTYFFPILKASIKLHIATWAAKNETDILNATKGGRIPIDKYITLKEAYDLRVEQVSSNLDKETFYVQENAKLKVKEEENSVEIQELKNRVSNADNSLAEIKLFSSMEQFFGQWDAEVGHSPNLKFQKWSVDFKGVTISSFPVTSIRLVHYVCNYHIKHIVFMLEFNKTEGRSLDTYTFDITKKPLDELDGFINGTTPIKLKRTLISKNTIPDLHTLVNS